MNRARRRVDVAGSSSAQPLSVVLTIVGAVLLAATGIGCGQNSSHSQPLAAPGSITSSSSTINSGVDNNSDSSCPTQGVGGDSVAPVCVSGSETSSGPTFTPPPTVSATLPPSPTVTAVSPSSGAEAGGDAITITGSGFIDVTQVNFGDVSAEFRVVSYTEITAVSPPGAGTVDINIVTSAGTSASAGQFTYVASQTPPSSGDTNPSVGSSS
jgi:IPT/TIG domain